MYHVNVSLPADSASLAGKNNDFILGPIFVSRQSGEGNAFRAAHFGLNWFQVPIFFCMKMSVLGLLDNGLGTREKIDKMRILWPDAVRNLELLHMDVHEARIFGPLLQLRPGTDLITGLLECAVDFVLVLLERSTIITAIFRVRLAV